MRRAASALAVLLVASGAEATERVVTLSPHLAELVCAAGACNQLVGVVAYSNFPEPVRRLPQVGDAFAVNAEAVLALRPTRVLFWEGGTARDLTERLRSLDLPLTGVHVTGLADIGSALRSLGQLLGTAAAAEHAADAYERKLGQLRAVHREASPVRVLYQIELEPMYSVNRDSPISEAIALCGGINVFADAKPLSFVVSKEAVLAAAPEAIVHASEDGADAVRAWWSRWRQLPAVSRGAIYATDGDLLTRATPRMLEGVAQLCAALGDARTKIRRARGAEGPR